MDVRLSPEQAALASAAAQVADRLGVHAVADLDDAERAGKLDAAVAASGWRELRTADDAGRPWASAVEVALVAEELGRGLADTAFLGPTLAADLRRRAGAPPAGGAETVVLAPDLADPWGAEGGSAPSGSVAFDAAGAGGALVLTPGPAAVSLGLLSDLGPPGGPDLTRPGRDAGGGVVRPLPGARPLGSDDLLAWRALGLAAACADLVGTMRGALTLAVDYAAVRRQFGVPVGSFQAVQHLLADAQVALEGSRSIARHAAWAVDATEGGEALAAASAAKAYCARAARSVCETAIQVHGGVGNTWDCPAHLFLRRALVSSELLGGVGPSLERVLAQRGIGGDRGLR